MLELPPYASSLLAAQDRESKIVAIALQAHALRDAAGDSCESKDSCGSTAVAHH